MITKSALPRQVGINRNPIHCQSITLTARTPLQLLDLTPYLVSHSLDKAIRLQIPQTNSHYSQYNASNNTIHRQAFIHLQKIVTERQKRIESSNAKIRSIELEKRDKKGTQSYTKSIYLQSDLNKK